MPTPPYARYSQVRENEIDNQTAVYQAELRSVTLDPANVAATPKLDRLTVLAGLTGGWAALYAAAIASGKHIPGHRAVAGAQTHASQTLGHVVDADNPRLPLIWRAWAKNYAPSLIDANAEQPTEIAALPSNWW